MKIARLAWGWRVRTGCCGLLYLALACGKTADEPPTDLTGGNGAGGASSGGSVSGGAPTGGRSLGGATSGGRAMGGKASGGDDAGGALGGLDAGGAGGESGEASGGALTGGVSSGGLSFGGAGGAGGEVTTAHHGTIAITNAAERVPSQFTVSPSFATLDTATSCRRVTYGDCVVSDMCLSTANLPNYVSAGTIRVAIPRRNIELVGEPTAAMGFMPLYAPMVSEAAFEGGDGFEIETSGSASVPAFTARISLPQPIRLRADPDAQGVIHAPRSQDLTLDLQATAQVITFELRGAASTSATQALLSCSVKAWGAPLVVKAAALDAIGYPQRLSIRSLHLASTNVGDWRVDMPVTFEVVDQNLAVIDAIAID